MLVMGRKGSLTREQMDEEAYCEKRTLDTTTL